MSSFSAAEEKRVFHAALLVVGICGAGVFFINSWTNAKLNQRARLLNRALWKFDPLADPKIITRTRLWSWRKLVFAGLMMSALLVSTMVRVMKVERVIFAAAVLFSGWMSFLFYYWYFVILREVARNEEREMMAIRNQESVATGATDVKASGGGGWAAKARVVVQGIGGKDITTSRNKINCNTRREEKSAAVNGDTGEGEEIRRGMLTKDRRLPVTIVTGYLGSGKTTLVKGILRNTIGMKVLVIENEIGAEGIDHTLLMQHTAKEDIILMNNGCICCTVRQDLLSTFRRMFANEAFARLDWIVIETTGLADPAPLIQTLYMDTECQARMRLDSVLTVVDCKHIAVHLSMPSTGKNTMVGRNTVSASASASATSSTLSAFSASAPAPFPFSAGAKKSANAGTGPASAHGGLSEAVLQITFADRILLNKTDLVSAEYLAALTETISELNCTAGIIACEHSRVPVEDLLNIRAFDPSSAANRELLLLTVPSTSSDHTETTNADNIDDNADAPAAPTGIGNVTGAGTGVQALEGEIDGGIQAEGDREKGVSRTVDSGNNKSSAEKCSSLKYTASSSNNSSGKGFISKDGYSVARPVPVFIRVDKEGKILRERIKFNATAPSLSSSSTTKQNRGSGVLNSVRKLNAMRGSPCISTITLRICGDPLDLFAFNAWVSTLLQEEGARIYRLKGVLSMAGYDEQFVAQGVHMIFDGERGQLWLESSPSSSGTTTNASNSSISSSNRGIENQPKLLPVSERVSTLVLIGLNIHQLPNLEEQFRQCTARAVQTAEDNRIN